MDNNYFQNNQPPDKSSNDSFTQQNERIQANQQNQSYNQFLPVTVLDNNHNKQDVQFTANIKSEHQETIINNTEIICSVGQNQHNTQQQDKSKWEWLPCTFIMKQYLQEKSILWSLKPNIQLGNPRQQPDGGINIKLDITMDRNFIYDEKLGWNWHKSWIIPSICVNFDIYDSRTGEQYRPPKNTHAQIFAVKTTGRGLQNFHLIDLGIKGNDKVSLEEGSVTFSAVKFTSTSYNNDGNKFNLVVAVTIQDEKDFYPRIIDAKISPPIFVDSRKSAREPNSNKDVKTSTFYELFQPDIFWKPLVKRMKKQQESQQERITNDTQGLINYFSAPNIRNKVKHPFFLACKFSNCVNVYYNQDKFHQKKLHEIIERCISILVEFKNKKEIPVSKKFTMFDKVNLNAYLTIFIHVDNEQNKFIVSKKICELIGQIDNNIANICFDTNYLKDNFKHITNIETIRKAYKIYYNKYNKSGLTEQPYPKKNDEIEEIKGSTPYKKFKEKQSSSKQSENVSQISEQSYNNFPTQPVMPYHQQQNMMPQYINQQQNNSQQFHPQMMAQMNMQSCYNNMINNPNFSGYPQNNPQMQMNQGQMQPMAVNPQRQMSQNQINRNMQQMQINQNQMNQMQNGQFTNQQFNQQPSYQTQQFSASKVKKE